MAGPEGGVWGNEVIVPEGEKLSPQTAQHVKPAGGDDAPDKTTEGASGDENTSTDDDGGKTQEGPVVRLEDGTEVPIGDYDPFAQQRAELETEKARVDGMLSVINNGNGNGDETGGDATTETQPAEHPLLAENNPLLQKIELDPNDNLITDDERAAAARHNNLVDAYRQQIEDSVEREKAMQKEVAAIRDTVGDRFVREDIAKATATSGVTEQELLAASRATGITDVQTLATLVVGEKAMQTARDEAEAAAEAKREEDAAAIGGGTQGGGGTTNTQPEGRGVKNWRDPSEVGAAYKFGATS